MWDNPRQLNFIAGLLTAFSIVMLAAALTAWLSRHPAFAIRNVAFEGDIRHVNPAHLRSIVAEELSGTFFTLNLDHARHAFAKVPWVREVAVRRQWPDRLAVTIREHRPLARWQSAGLVDVEGDVFVANYDGELPQFAGPDGSSRAVLQAYRRFATLLASANRAIAEIRLSDRQAWTLTLDNGIAVELGRDESEARLGRFVAWYRRAIAPLTRDASLKIDLVDMRYRNGFAVRAPGFREPSAVALAKPAPVRSGTKVAPKKKP